jgi:hypothetical protein
MPLDQQLCPYVLLPLASPMGRVIHLLSLRLHDYTSLFPTWPPLQALCDIHPVCVCTPRQYACVELRMAGLL